MKKILIICCCAIFLALGACKMNKHDIADISREEWVDLGLPSGLFWCSHNLGAVSPEDYGDYYSWGETMPKSNYDWSTYRYGNSYNKLTKYCTEDKLGLDGFIDNLTVLQQVDDAAAVISGDGARIPREYEWSELLENTTHTWTTLNSINGMLFTGSNGNSIFLPAAGGIICPYYDDVYYNLNKLSGMGFEGHYWSSTLNLEDPFKNSIYGVSIYCPRENQDDSFCTMIHFDYCRSSGYSVRAVKSPH